MSKARMMADLLGSDGNVKSTKMSSGAARKGSSGRTDLGMDNQDQLTVDSSGNLTLPGTVDGRVVSVDGAKLDGIEVGAKADQDLSTYATQVYVGTTVSAVGVLIEDGEVLALAGL